MAKEKMLTKKEMQNKITELTHLLKESLKLLKVKTDSAADAPAPKKALVPGETLKPHPIIPLPIPKPKPGKKPDKQKYFTGYDSTTQNMPVKMIHDANGNSGRPWWKLPGRVNADGKIVSVPRVIPVY